MTILEIVRHKVKNLAITEIDIQIALDEVEQAIKNYCNIDELPDALIYTHANMTVDLVKYNYESNLTSDEIENNYNAADVSSIKVGDTQIQLQGNSGGRGNTLRSHRPNLDDIVMNNREQLNKFRRMVF